jgi:hypothetical protein
MLITSVGGWGGLPTYVFSHQSVLEFRQSETQLILPIPNVYRYGKNRSDSDTDYRSITNKSPCFRLYGRYTVPLSNEIGVEHLQEE